MIVNTKKKLVPFKEEVKRDPVVKTAAQLKQEELDAQMIAQLLEEDESRMLAEQL